MKDLWAAHPGSARRWPDIVMENLTHGAVVVQDVVTVGRGVAAAQALDCFAVGGQF
jgi:hypothetical protein